KTAEELLKEKGITPETAHHNYAYVYRAVCEVIGEAQKEAYNHALEDAAENAACEYEKDYLTGEIDKQSILKLKK
ncbi:MAG: hypothetical protein PHO36_16665, partial [Parabacteroides sp.]|nr:hypothetical protein [Parabacteroides sp.]